MEKYYSDPSAPASFSGIDKIARDSGKKPAEVAAYLNDIETYSLHKPVKRRFKRSSVVVGGINNQFDCDLFDVTRYKKWNKGYSYILIVIDVFSRFLMVHSLKTKKAVEVRDALENILTERKCYNLRSDAGSEFVNSHVSKLLKDKSIKHFIARNTETKASYAERVIRTLSKKLFRYFSEKYTYNWIDVIQDLVSSYNRTFHRTIGIAPIKVDKTNEAEIWRKLYISSTRVPLDYKYKSGDVVRISVLKGNFKKDRDENYSRELFIITDRYRRSGIPIYKIKDFSSDEIVGSLYEEELSLVLVNDTTEYKIDNILGKRTRKGKKELLVSWRGWPTKFNSYIDASIIK